MGARSMEMVSEVLAGAVGPEERRLLQSCAVEVKYECPRCESQDIWKNGLNSAGNQQYRCKTCGRVFVAQPYKPKALVTIADRMLESDIPVPQISQILKGFVSRRWLYNRKGALRG